MKNSQFQTPEVQVSNNVRTKYFFTPNKRKYISEIPILKTSPLRHEPAHVIYVIDWSSYFYYLLVAVSFKPEGDN